MPIIGSIETIGAGLRDLPSVIDELKLVVLLGSFAKGRATSQSDVDLGILCDGDFDPDTLFLAIAPRLKTDRLDIVDLRRASPLLAFEAARHGILLFEAEPGLFRSFQSLAYRRYCDTAKLRLATRTRIHRFLEKQGLA